MTKEKITSIELELDSRKNSCTVYKRPNYHIKTQLSRPHSQDFDFVIQEFLLHRPHFDNLWLRTRECSRARYDQCQERTQDRVSFYGNNPCLPHSEPLSQGKLKAQADQVWSLESYLCRLEYQICHREVLYQILSCVVWGLSASESPVRPVKNDDPSTQSHDMLTG
jgi:hypothetical protein